MARGVRGEKSRLAGGIELFAICDVVIGEGRGELGILSSARLIKFYKNIMTDYDRMQFAYLVIKLVSSASEMVEGPEWYDILAEVLASLDTISIPLDLIQTWFYLRHASIMGYELSLWYDDTGSKLLPDKKYNYDESERGLKLSENGRLTADHIKLLRLISSKSIRLLLQVGGINQILSECLLVARQHASISG